MTIDELIRNFKSLDGWEERYRYLIALGRKLEPLDKAYKTSAFRVQGCTSQVWLVQRPTDDDRLRFAADSDSAIVKGLAAVLLTACSNHTAEEILATDLEGIFARIGLDQHMLPNRRSGFFSMLEAIKASAKGRRVALSAEG